VTYHIHTQDNPNLERIAARHFAGFTIAHAQGYWQGTAEPAAVIEVSTQSVQRVLGLAKDIKQTNRQQTVLVEAYSTKELFV